MRISRLKWDDYRVEHIAQHDIEPEIAEMSKLQVPEFKTYEEEAAFWDNLDTSAFMEGDGEWFHFETPDSRAIRVAILPEVANELAQRARAQGVSVETLVNVWLIEHLYELARAG
jgi:hypothetical protein